MLQINCIICINLLHKVIFILQGQFVSHLDRMPSVKGASLPILSIPKTVSKSAVTHIGMHSPPHLLYTCLLYCHSHLNSHQKDKKKKDKKKGEKKRKKERKKKKDKEDKNNKKYRKDKKDKKREKKKKRTNIGNVYALFPLHLSIDIYRYTSLLHCTHLHIAFFVILRMAAISYLFFKDFNVAKVIMMSCVLNLELLLDFYRVHTAAS